MCSLRWPATQAWKLRNSPQWKVETLILGCCVHLPLNHSTFYCPLAYLNVCSRCLQYSIQHSEQLCVYTVMLSNFNSGPHSADPSGRGLRRQEFPWKESEWASFSVLSHSHSLKPLKIIFFSFKFFPPKDYRSVHPESWGDHGTSPEGRL